MINHVLVILSNRLDPQWKTRYYEIDSRKDGTVVREIQLKRAPTKPAYDEVWENDDGKTDIDSCTRMKRHYKHRLLKSKGA